MGPRTVAEGTFLLLTPAIENYFLFVVLKSTYIVFYKFFNWEFTRRNFEDVGVFFLGRKAN
jgi:hypothetical protein